jgi:transcriptional regulator with XRE-family HTH domain
MGRVDTHRLGAVVRALRIRRGWRQLDLAVRAAVPRSSVSKLERGRLGELSVDTVVRIAEALGARLDLVLRWQGGDLDRLVNARHSALHESVARHFLALPGWVLAPEVSFSIRGERGVIDILAWHAASGTLLVIELKTEIVDMNDLMGLVDRKRRLATEIGRNRGWNAATVAVWVIVGDSSTNRRRVASHATTLRAAFPVDGRSIGSWLRDPAGPVACLSFWSDDRRASTKGGLATVKRVRRPTADAA